MPRYVLISFLSVLVSHPALAMTHKEGAENLLYFVYAGESAKYCENKGTAARPALKAWEAKHAHLFNRSLAAIRSHAKNGGLDEAGQNQLLLEAIETHKRLSQEAIAKKDVPCASFSTWLDGLAGFMKR